MEQLGKRHLIIPDTQVKPDVPLDHLSWCGEYIIKMKPDVIVCIGDFADMPSLCSYDSKSGRSFEGRRYDADIKAVHKGMKMLLKPLRDYQDWSVKNHKTRYEPRLVLTLGNHEDRITRAVEDDPHTREGRMGLYELEYEKFGWEVIPYLQPVVIDGIAYCHYFPTGKKGLPANSARQIIQNHHMSCFAGHAQGRDIAYGKRIDGQKITAIICGSFYQHDEDYMPPPNNQHWRGIYVLHEVKDGSFDEMPVSLAYLKSRYGK